MKFLCKTEFFHSGNRLYTAGTVYNDITAKVAKELIAVDKKTRLGALSFFTPIDEEAMNFVKEAEGNPEPCEGKKGNETPPDGGDTTVPPKQPSRAELIAEAKNLGIKGADKMTEEELKQVIDVAKLPNPGTRPQG